MNDMVKYKGHWYIQNNLDRAIANVITYLPEHHIRAIVTFKEDESPMNAFLRKKHENTFFCIMPYSKMFHYLIIWFLWKLNPSYLLPIIK